jgi:hypothetical protein
MTVVGSALAMTVGGVSPSLRGGEADVAVHVPLDRHGPSALAMTSGGDSCPADPGLMVEHEEGQ